MSLPATQKISQESEAWRESQLNPVRFALVCSVLLAAVVLVPERFLDPLNRATACLSGFCLALFGGHASVSRDLISLDGFQVRIITECTALYSTLVFGSFLISVPASLKARLAGLASGACFLCCVNMLRIAAVVRVGATRPLLFELFHVYLGQVVMVVMVIGACLAWLQTIDAQRPRRETLTFLARFGVCSSLVFLAWFIFNVDYVRLTDIYVIRRLFSWRKIFLDIPYRHMIYYQTFNLVTFSGLVLAGGGKVLRWKLRIVALGLASIVGMHILFRFGNALMTGYGMESARQVSDIIYLVGQYMVPLLLWILMCSGEKPMGKIRS